MDKKPDLMRRRIVQGVTAATLLPLLGANLIGCSDSSDRTRQPSVPADFLHGVASGDPLQDRVILWTRLSPERDGTVQVDWEIASDREFTDVVNQGSGTTAAEVDYTVKVDASGLAPGTRYYYRFTCGENVSPIGSARTAPSGLLAAASFAVLLLP